MFYFLLGNILVAVMLGIRSKHSTHTSFLYLQEHYPEKEREFGWFGHKSAIALYKEHDIDDDQEFLRLKTRTRNATTWTIVALLPISLFIILILIMAVPFWPMNRDVFFNCWLILTNKKGRSFPGFYLLA